MVARSRNNTSTGVWPSMCGSLLAVTSRNNIGSDTVCRPPLVTAAASSSSVPHPVHFAVPSGRSSPVCPVAYAALSRPKK
ncbi:MAG: hypothetical protein IPI13_15755 [Actinomycetales bacterium]|uniref:Uncharacterized protein n=1 Tax=Candidatus Phosphoribacter hodrii TaxID=2953743 RepID=A0A935M835_9MICO|nr:hypothetical protein [Candidatus Phosphoribacter hodrii]